MKMAEQAKEHEKRFSVDGREVTQVRYDIKLDKDSVLPRAESADLRFFKGRKEIAAYEGLTRDELAVAVGAYNKANIENGVGANQRGNSKDAIKGKLEKDSLVSGEISTAGLESKLVQNKNADKSALGDYGFDTVQAQDAQLERQLAAFEASQQQEQDFSSAPVELDSREAHIVPAAQSQDAELAEVNSIEPDIEQERVLPTMDDEVKRNVARMWLKKNADPVQTAEQDTPQEELGQSGGNEIDDDDVFADRNATTTYRQVVPKDVESSYLRVGNKFHYSSKPDLQAFEDKGNKLETKSNSERVAADLVKIAHARGWNDIKVKGSEEFRRQVWLEASLQGMQVKGYKPSDADKALLEKRERESPSNAIERDGPTQQRPTPSRPAEKPAKAAETPQKADSLDGVKPVNEAGREALAAEREAKVAMLAGVLLEHGKAKFNFDKDEKESYFVKYRDDKGDEKIVWGVDLARAMKESKAEVGQRVELENKGKQPVTVNAPVRNEEGKVVGFEKKETHRNAWEVKADAFRNQDPKEAVKQHPELVNAYAIVKAAELVAKDKFKTTEDQQRFVGMAKESLAKQIEQNKAIPEVTIKNRQQATEQKRELSTAKELER
jgi:putative DNA primase/helicase